MRPIKKSAYRNYKSITISKKENINEEVNEENIEEIVGTGRKIYENNYSKYRTRKYDFEEEYNKFLDDLRNNEIEDTIEEKEEIVVDNDKAINDLLSSLL